MWVFEHRHFRNPSLSSGISRICRAYYALIFHSCLRGIGLTLIQQNNTRNNYVMFFNPRNDYSHTNLINSEITFQLLRICVWRWVPPASGGAGGKKVISIMATRKCLSSFSQIKSGALLISKWRTCLGGLKRRNNDTKLKIELVEEWRYDYLTIATPMARKRRASWMWVKEMKGCLKLNQVGVLFM